MNYSPGSRVKYRDTLDGPVGRVVAYRYNEEVEEWMYLIEWADLPGQWATSSTFVHRDLEVY